MKADIAIAGGGLAGSLIAWRLRQSRPDLRVVVVDQGDRLGGNHTWSFHTTDLSPEILEWIDPLIVHRWARQQVRFPSYERMLETGYNSITSERLHEIVIPSLGENFIAQSTVSALSATRIVLKDGREIEAGAVIDARGQRHSDALIIGFQKFLGQVVHLEHPHGLKAPIIMDATISQTDGFRFIYVLPFTEDSCLIEDTYYADGSDLDMETVRAEIKEYCLNAGWRIASVGREEHGILPIALAGDIEQHLAGAPPGVGVAGLGAGLFHPLTGYSLPDAVGLAHMISQESDISGPMLSKLTRDFAAAKWKEREFYRLLARMLYYAAKPERRITVLQRYYSLSQPVIERLYAAKNTTRDKMRTLIGKPPVNIFKAMECVDEGLWRKKVKDEFAVAGKTA